MLFAILKDLRMAKLRTFLSGFSMFVGIIAVIASVMVGVLGRQYLEAVNARMSGWAPTYSSILAVDDDHAAANAVVDLMNVRKLIDSLKSNEAAEFTNDIALKAASIVSLSEVFGDQSDHGNQDDSPAETNQIDEDSDVVGSLGDGTTGGGVTQNGDATSQEADFTPQQRSIYERLAPVETKIITDHYNVIFNLSMKRGSWFDSSTQLSVIINEAAANYFTTDYLVLNTADSLALTPMTIRGVVADGEVEPRIFMRAGDLIEFASHLLLISSIDLYAHPSCDMSLDVVRSRFEDISADSVNAKVREVYRSDQGDNYLAVIQMIELSLMVSAVLLLFVSILGQINIGLASLEQRTSELLIRRAIGASSKRISFEIFVSVIVVSVAVSIVSIAFSLVMFSIVRSTVLGDGVVRQVFYPFEAAGVAVLAAIITGVISGVIPALKAARLEPALVLR